MSAKALRQLGSLTVEEEQRGQFQMEQKDRIGQRDVGRTRGGREETQEVLPGSSQLGHREACSKAVLTGVAPSSSPFRLVWSEQNCVFLSGSVAGKGLQLGCLPAVNLLLYLP